MPPLSPFGSRILATLLDYRERTARNAHMERMELARWLNVSLPTLDHELQVLEGGQLVRRLRNGGIAFVALTPLGAACASGWELFAP